MDMSSQTAITLFAIGAYVILANVLGYVCAAQDYRRAEAQEPRLPALTLLLVAVAGGWFGVKLGMIRGRDLPRGGAFGMLVNLAVLPLAAGIVAVFVPLQDVATTAMASVQSQIDGFLPKPETPAAEVASASSGASVVGTPDVAASDAAVAAKAAAAALPLRIGPGSGAAMEGSIIPKSKPTSAPKVGKRIKAVVIDPIDTTLNVDP